ncbi:MAG: hypothetical protein K6C14_00625, partial [Eubacterium sp.]|nr:hypothetical protein [Eubacterium sp.]
MNDFIKKQKRFKRIRDIMLILTALIILTYIGAEPYLPELGLYQPMLFALVLISLSLLLIYESGYAKAASFLEKINYEITDSGCYLTARTESDTDSYLSAVKTDLINDG